MESGSKLGGRGGDGDDEWKGTIRWNGWWPKITIKFTGESTRHRETQREDGKRWRRCSVSHDNSFSSLLLVQHMAYPLTEHSKWQFFPILWRLLVELSKSSSVAHPYSRGVCFASLDTPSSYSGQRLYGCAWCCCRQLAVNFHHTFAMMMMKLMMVLIELVVLVVWSHCNKVNRLLSKEKV